MILAIEVQFSISDHHWVVENIQLGYVIVNIHFILPESFLFLNSKVESGSTAYFVTLFHLTDCQISSKISGAIIYLTVCLLWIYLNPMSFMY